MHTTPYRRSLFWATGVVLALLSSCTGSTSPTTTALDPDLTHSVAELGDDEASITLNLAEALNTTDPVGRMAAAVIVVTPADLDGNNDFFVPVGQFAPGTIFNISDLLVAGVLEADYLAQGSLIISFSPNQNQTIITLRNRTTGFRVRIRIRGGDFRGQISLANFVFDEPTVVIPTGIVNTAMDVVADDGMCSLREAIAANNNNQPENGCNNPAGTITFVNSLVGETILISTTALPTISADVKIQGLGADQLTISGNDQFRIFEIAANNNPVVTIEKLTLTDGRATYANGGAILSASKGLLTIDSVKILDSTVTGFSEIGRGGGIRTDGDVMVSNSTISGNSAGSNGGGIYAPTVTLSDSTVSSNNAGLNGGGIRATTATTVSDSTLNGNSAGSNGGSIYASITIVTDSSLTDGFAGNVGGGILATTATVSDSTLSGNTAVKRGGGISIANSVSVSNSTLEGNSAGYGGGINAETAQVSNSILQSNRANFGGGISATTATVSFTTLAGNTAGSYGGGINADSVTTGGSTFTNNQAQFYGGGINANSVIVSNSTLSGNSVTSSSGSGGGIRAKGASITNSTLILNRASNGGGIQRRSGSNPFVVNNTIVAGNTNNAGTILKDINNTLTSGSNNLIGDKATSGGLTDGANGNIVGVADINLVLNTILAANSPTIQAGDPNVGTEPVLTHALVPNSPALEAGDPAICAAAPVNNQDQRDQPRPQTGTNCDIGSFESDLAAPSLMGIVNTLLDESGSEADCSLREAIIANNNSAPFGGCVDPKGTITFATALSGGTITITNTALPAITEDVVIDGPGANDLTVSGNKQFRVFEIPQATSPVVTIQELTLTEGLATDLSGGAVFSDSTGLLTMNSVTISNSTATGNFPNGLGGGIFASYTVAVSNSTLSGNSGEVDGGGIATTSATVSNSTLNSNSASRG
ncbi:MAG: hypothetical protein HC924_18445, partial [Synechococcaceae cyanobacterium SM2_3_2]|nr:hypothetical protein [Synechococcaceae cyanobacterium SM2_3_2]